MPEGAGRTGRMARDTGRTRTPRTRPGTASMPAEHAVLALLAMAGGTGHGYDLARQFQDGQPLGEVLRLEPSMLYHHLKKLERNAWVTSAVEPQGSRPPRQVHTLTAAGRAEVDDWLAEPVQRTREIRLDFLVKLYFARHLTPESVPALVDRQREILTDALTRLQNQVATATKTAGEGAGFTRDVLDLRFRQTQAAIDWLDGVQS